MKKNLLTAEELRLWVEWKSKPNTSIKHLNFQYRLDNAVDIKRLNLALTTAVSVFDVLRAYFIEEHGVPYRIVLPAKEVQVDFIDLTQDTLADSTSLEKAANKYRIELIKKPFDLTKVSLFRCALIKFSTESYYFIFVIPRILGDAYSLHLFLKVLSCVYNKAEEEKLELISQYKKHRLREPNDAQTKGIPEISELESYWKTKFDNASCQVGFNNSKKLSSKPQSKRIWIRLPVKLISDLKNLAAVKDTNLFTLFASAISIFLYRYFGEEDISLSYPANVRTGKYDKQSFGFFLNELGLRVQLSGKLSFYEVLSNIIQQSIMDGSYQQYPLTEMLLEKFRVDNPGLNFPFNVGLAPTYFLENKLVLRGIKVQAISFFSTEHSPKDLLFLYEDISTDKQQVELAIDYSTATFDACFMKQMVSHLRQLLEGIVSNPEGGIEKLELLSERERYQLLVEWNETESYYPADKTLVELFEEQVERSPDAIALVLEGEELRYRELNARANQLGHYLRSRGVVTESLVGICVERSFEMVIGILGILKAGGAYVPLDPEYPEERLQFMLEDTQAKVLVTPTRFAKKFVRYEGQVILWDHEKLQIAEQSKTNLSHWTSPKNLAYVMYTSGSTGKPKGVMVEQRGIVNLVYSLIEEWGLNPEDRVLQFARLIFDASVAEIFVTLLRGASLCLVSNTIDLIGENLAQVLKRESISILLLTPSALETVPFEASLSALRLISVGGEAPSLVTMEKWSQHYQLINWYGPTEDSVCTTLGKVDLSSRKLSIGKPLVNTKVYVLDPLGNPVPIGVIGELYIAGVGLARGYLNRPELTKERFIENPFASEKDKREGKYLRLYRSGDLVRYLADGTIEYIGRIDDQVKLRGYRIELGEIETILRQEPGVKDAVVILREDNPGQKRLVAYLVLEEKLLEVSETDYVSGLREHLEQQLPEYMVPGAFRVLERMPLTATGKLDRRGLPVPDKQYRVEAYVAPRTKVEQELASIWSDLLGIEQISVHDNFFKLGGHSLLAVRLIQLIEKKLGKVLSLARVFKHPTIKDLAYAFYYGEYNKDPLPDDLLIIQSKGNLPPLFLIHPASGLAIPYLALSLDNQDQPIYGISNPRLSSRVEYSFTTIEEMASAYLDTVQAVQKKGPYRFGGWSFGGVVALEMARQLQSRGETVEIVIMIDSYPVIQKIDKDAKERKLEEFKLKLDLSTQEIKIFQRELDNAFKMIGAYQTKSYEHRVALLKATEQEEGAGQINRLCNDWEPLFLPQLEVYSVLGRHEDLFDEPSVQKVSIKLNEILSTPIPAIFTCKKLSFFERQILAAAARNDTFLVKLFLDEIDDFNLNVHDHLGRTLSHWATYYGNSELIKV